jgi:hypothetical protein
MRHCAANIIEHGGGVGPIAADCLQRLGRRETTLSADEAILDSALAVGAMADFTIVSIDLLAVRDLTFLGKNIGHLPRGVDRRPLAAYNVIAAASSGS